MIDRRDEKASRLRCGARAALFWTATAFATASATACGGPPAAAPSTDAAPATAAAPPAQAPEASPAAGSAGPASKAACAPLMGRLDRLDRDGNSLDDHDPTHAAELLRKARELVDGAATDLDALDAKDAGVKSLGADYATYLRDRSAQLGQMVPLMEKMTAATSALKKSQDDADAAFKKCGNKTCKAWTDANARLAKDSETFASAQGVLKDYVRDARNKDTDVGLHRRETDLNQRLFTTCGRPLPPPNGR